MNVEAGCKCELCIFFKELSEKECSDTEETKINKLLFNVIKVLHSPDIKIKERMDIIARVLNISELTEWDLEEVIKNPTGHVMAFVKKYYNKNKDPDKRRRLQDVMGVIRASNADCNKKTLVIAGS